LVRFDRDLGGQFIVARTRAYIRLSRLVGVVQVVVLVLGVVAFYRESADTGGKNNIYYKLEIRTNF
jgi:hypothetical protein